jgi:F-type H+-transporting ATPase subunit alpha
VFYLHSRLLERAAKLSKEKGGGSLTALPIIETQLNDVTAYIPTNVISITDGQIYLESDLFNQGIRPAVNVGLSVSRVGSAAQTKAMKKVAGKLRLTLAQFRELQAFVQFASDVDEATKKRIREGQVMTEILKQNDLSPLPFEIQVVLFFAALRGHFNDAPLETIGATQEKFIEYLTSLHAETLAEIRTSGEITDATEAKLVEALERFTI